MGSEADYSESEASFDPDIVVQTIEEHTEVLNDGDDDDESPRTADDSGDEVFRSESKSPNVEPHALITAFRQDFVQQVIVHLDAVRLEVTKVPSNLEEVRDKARELGEINICKFEIKEQLLDVMDSSDPDLDLALRADKVSKRLEGVVEGDLAYWKGRLDYLRMAVVGVNGRGQLPNATESETARQNEKQKGYVFSMEMEVRHHLERLQMCLTRMASVKETLDWLAREVQLFPGDLYPLKSDDSASYGSPRDTDVSRYRSDDGLSKATMHTGAPESRRGSPLAPLTFNERFAGLGVSPWLNVPMSPPSRIGSVRPMAGGQRTRSRQ